jgi:rRNA methylases
MPNDFLPASQSQLKKWARLLEAKFRREDGLFMAEGVKVVEELLKSDWQAEALLVLPEKISYWEKCIARAAGRIPVYQLTRSEWKKLSRDKEPEGLIAIVKIKSSPRFPLFSSPPKAMF